MLKAVRRFFDRHLAPAAGGRGAPGDREDRGGRGEEASLRLATAALLVEALQADHQVDPRELEAVRELLEGFFGLGREEAAELLALARREAEEAVSLFQFTRLVDRGYDPATKERIVEMLWRVAYADGHKHHWEEHLVRKVAELLHVPHGAFVRARERAARERHPGGGGPTG